MDHILRQGARGVAVERADLVFRGVHAQANLRDPASQLVAHGLPGGDHGIGGWVWTRMVRNAKGGSDPHRPDQDHAQGGADRYPAVDPGVVEVPDEDHADQCGEVMAAATRSSDRQGGSALGDRTGT